MGKIILLLENIQVIAEGELVNRFTIGTIGVLYNHLFTMPVELNFLTLRIKTDTARTK